MNKNALKRECRVSGVRHPASPICRIVKQLGDLLALPALLSVMTAAAVAGVTVSSPKNGATVQSPVTVVASATATGHTKITGMAIYVIQSKSIRTIRRA